jgi:hypothetical protein
MEFVTLLASLVRRPEGGYGYTTAMTRFSPDIPRNLR